MRIRLFVGVLAVFLLLAFILVHGGTLFRSSPSIPYGKFVKVSNQDLAPPNTVAVYVQSWIGCPVGAAASWAVYNALSEFGNLTYYTHYSDPLDRAANHVPGLIFENFTPRHTALNPTTTVTFQIAYLYNEYLNGTPSGIPLNTSQLIPVGETELRQSFPSSVANLIIQYETQVPVQGYGKPSALIPDPPHLNFGILVSGPNGTWLLTTPLVSTSSVEGMEPSYVMSHLDQVPSIVNGTNQLLLVISMASGGQIQYQNCLVTPSY